MEKCQLTFRLDGNSPAFLPYALLDAIAKDETLLDPSEMFKVSAGQGEIDAEDAAYWNVEIAAEAAEETPLHHDPLILAGLELGGVLLEEEAPCEPVLIAKSNPDQDTGRLVRYVGSYLDSVHLIHDEAKRAKLQAKLLTALMDGVQDDEGTYTVVGLRDPDFMKYPVHAEKLTRYVRGWLKKHRFVFTGCEDEAAAKIVDLAKQAFGLTPVELDIFEKFREMRDEEHQRELTVTLKADRSAASALAKQPKRKRKKLNLLAVPDDEPETVSDMRPLAPKRRQTETDEHVPQQLAMF